MSGVINQKGILTNFSELFNFANEPSSVPSSVNSNIQPIVEINPLAYPKNNIVKSATSTSTIYTTPTDKDFYLTQVSLSGGRVTSSSGTSAPFVKAYVDGTEVVVASISISTGEVSGDFVQAADGNYFVSFLPIKIDRNTNITTDSGGTTGGFYAIIYGFTYDNNATGLTAQNY